MSFLKYAYFIGCFCLTTLAFADPPTTTTAVTTTSASQPYSDAITEAAASPTTVYQGQIQSILNNWRARSGIPGATLSVYLPDHDLPLTFSSGTTAYAGGEPINSNTLFQAGSITKSFTSMIVLQLEADGKLSINDSITKYLPQYPQWSNVTIRELLNHTSGIFNYTETTTFNEIRKSNPDAEFTPDEIVRIASQHPNYFAPGKGWKYSNTNYVLAGMIIQQVTGEPVSDVMNHYLHGGVRLNLLNTYYLPGMYSNAFLTRMAHGYNSQGMDVTDDNMSWAYTAGAIVTTTQDLLSWWRDLFQGNLLPQTQLAEMMSLVGEGNSSTCAAGEPMSHLSDDQIGKGYGLGIIQDAFGSDRLGTVWWHNGSTAGYKAIVMWFPKSDIYMALTINRDPGYLLKPALPIVRDVMDVLIPNAEWHLQHPKPVHHLLHHKFVKTVKKVIPVKHSHHAKTTTVTSR
jgi:D-alanyl-D-alanine carboxypeptidase